MKTVNTLVKDIYALMKTKRIDPEVDAEAEIDRFGEAVKDLMRKEFISRGYDARKLRLSNVGRKDRFLWNHYRGLEKEPLETHNLIKFLYGHLIEEMLLFLVRMAGHTVTDEQKTCEVEDIKGSMDCRIDGVVTDVKSTSSYGFKKFKDGSLAFDDPFGYIDQIKAYSHSEGEKKFGWLAMDKQNGHLTFLQYDLEDKQSSVYDTIKEDISARIKHVKEMVKKEERPEPCYDPVPDGKSGNMKLPVGCSYCHFKKTCYPDVRTFLYSTGPRFLVEVHNEPKVQEIF